MMEAGLGRHLSPKAPILPLTSVRIFAALYVVLLHCTYWTHGYDVTTWFGRFVRNGYTAVGFFFTLSGYILAHVYLHTDHPFSTANFWTARFARAYPLLFASLLFDVPRHLLIGIPHHNPPNDLLTALVSLVTESMLLQSWSGIFRNLNAPSWSLSAEAFFYLLFPFTAFWIWRHKAGKAVLTFLLLWFTAMLVPTLVTFWKPELFAEVTTGSQLQQSVELMPIFRIFEFLAGVALCSIQQSLIVKLAPSTVKSLGYVALATSLLLFIVVVQFANHIPILVMSDGFLLPIYGLAILGLVNVQGPLQTVFSHKALILLGEASYAVYLLHIPLLFYFQHFFTMTTGGSWSLYVATVIVLSIASLFFVERPARRAILAHFPFRYPRTQMLASVGHS